MNTYQTPGVYVEENPTLPPSVAEVSTAVPAFVGYTAKGKAGEVETAEVTTLLEYEQRFGRGQPTDFQFQADGTLTPINPIPTRMLWYAMSLYFRNGGGRCWVVSVDNEKSPLEKERFEAGLKALEGIDGPTLIVLPEIVSPDMTAGYKQTAEAALAHCAKLKNRFAILDVSHQNSTDQAVSRFREQVTDNLAYGAAYYPYLDTTLSHRYEEEAVKIVGEVSRPSSVTPTDEKLTALAKDVSDEVKDKVRELIEPSAPTEAMSLPKNLADLRTTDTARYNSIKRALAEQRVRLPPSAAIAGVYARVDRERGIWKAPANVGLMSVIGPTVPISHEQQDRLNVDATTGKSINAIRSFPGRGTLVWGARTLAGNDNEWRYVPVRRLFIMIEESVKKASAFAVFEPNDATTWLKVRGMIESYLYGLWEQGALQGAEPKAAYYVGVGLNKTMTPQDILEGRMVVEIGIAAVRPAEFIVLRFSHKLAEA